MMCKDGRFNTGNKVCSNDLRDLNDDVIIVDGYVNSQELYVEDRLGIERLTLAGIQNKSDKQHDEIQDRADIQNAAINERADSTISKFEGEIDAIIKDAGGIEVFGEFGDSPEKVISQKKISEHLGQDSNGNTVIKSKTKTFTFPETGGEVLINSSLLTVIKVPSDEPNLQSAFDRSKATKGDVEILIEKDHVLTSGLYVSNGNYSNVTLKSENSPQLISGDFKGVLSKLGLPEWRTPSLLVLDNAYLKLDVLFSGENYRDVSSDGKFKYIPLNCVSMYSSTIFTTSGSGGVHFTGRGLYARGSKVYARLSKWDDSGDGAIQITEGSIFSVGQATGLRSCWNLLGDPTAASMSFSRGSSGQAQEVDASNSFRTGVDVRRSDVNLAQLTATNCIRAGLCLRNGCTVYANEINLGSGYIELRNDGGGTAYLGKGSVYAGIKSFSPSYQHHPNTLIPGYGVVYDNPRGAIEGDNNEGLVFLGNGRVRIWKTFKLNENGSDNFDDYRVVVPSKYFLASQSSSHQSSLAAFSISGVTWRSGGSGTDTNLFKICANSFATYVPAESGWVIRHPFKGVQTTNVVEGVVWAEGVLLN